MSIFQPANQFFRNIAFKVMFFTFCSQIQDLKPLSNTYAKKKTSNMQASENKNPLNRPPTLIGSTLMINPLSLQIYHSYLEEIPIKH